jgi:hypothetical protein
MRVWAGAVAAVVLMSGCGTAFAGTVGGSPTATVGRVIVHDGAPGGSRAEATAIARRLLAVLPLPAGTRDAGRRPVPPGMSAPAAPPGDWLVLTRLLVAPGSPGQLKAYLLAHAPRGATVSFSASQTFGEPEVTGITFDLPGPRGIETVELGFQLQRLSSASTLVYADAFVVWYPPRSAAEQLTASDFRAVTVTADTVSPGAPNARHISRTFTQRAVIAMLTGFVDSLPAAPYYAVPCPLMSSYSLRFMPAHHHARVVVSSLSCVADSVTVGGADQPALWDSPPRLAVLAQRLLGLSARLSSGARLG